MIRGRRGHDRLVVGFTTTNAIRAYTVSPQQLWIWITLKRGVLDTTFCDNDYRWLMAGPWFSSGTPGFFTNKTDSQDITTILVQVALNIIILTLKHF